MFLCFSGYDSLYVKFSSGLCSLFEVVCVLRRKKNYPCLRVIPVRSDVLSNSSSTFVDEVRQNTFEESERPKVFSREFVTYDKNGEEISRTQSRITSQNGSGFVISYSDKVSDLVVKISSPCVLRVFIYLSHHQTYDGGYRCSRKHLAEVLDIDPKSVYSSLKYLQENFLVIETRVDGQLEFMVNPNYVTIGSDKKKRLALWNQRWQDLWQRTNGKNVSVNSRS